MNELALISNAINYINTNKKEFIQQFTLNIQASDDKIAIFTAGMSGVGKTEFGQFLKMLAMMDKTPISFKNLQVKASVSYLTML